MDAIDIMTIEQNGNTYRVSIYPDSDAPNPLEDWSEMGTILSLNRSQVNFDPAGVESAIENNRDAVPLSYYEHGLCLWSVAGELPAGARCPFDSVDCAGVWLPDAQTMQAARNYGGRTRRLFMRKRARQACEVYAQWCNGEVYGYEIERIAACLQCGHEQARVIESCWGFYGLDYCRGEAAAVAIQQPQTTGALEIQDELP